MDAETIILYIEFVYMPLEFPVIIHNGVWLISFNHFKYVKFHKRVITT